MEIYIYINHDDLIRKLPRELFLIREIVQGKIDGEIKIIVYKLLYINYYNALG